MIRLEIKTITDYFLQVLKIIFQSLLREIFL